MPQVHKFPSGILYNADCFDVLKLIPDGAVDMILCDLPYGTTQNSWDCTLSLPELWKQYWRVCKATAAIVLTAQTPFDKALGVSCLSQLKYEWIWQKTTGSGHLNAKIQPMKSHENVLVFYRKQCVYNPIMELGKPYTQKSGKASSNYGEQVQVITENEGFRYPKSVLTFARDKDRVHPTQKPVALFEYLIKTYTNENDIVLDNCAGSGTTAVAAMNLKRRWICIEKEEKYYDIAVKRITENASSS